MSFFLPLLLVMAASVAAEPEDPLASFRWTVGDYALVGREPERGALYAGRATIEVSMGRFKMLRWLENGTTATLEGRVEMASPPGDVQVLRFRGPETRPRTYTCMAGSDLDNYARLTCIWTYDDKTSPREPGLEALFPTAVWPEARQE
ncbi:MAG TPA: hypothetical protein VF017_08235 [Thermoanaerobaculia bacterium]|nr:hypothetical protein [Thermoanaerobaculia bacterium]